MPAPPGESHDWAPTVPEDRHPEAHHGDVDVGLGPVEDGQQDDDNRERDDNQQQKARLTCIFGL